MTREEAIDVLKHNYPSTCFTDLCEAVETAIQALSEQAEIIHCRKCKHWIDNDGFNHDKGAECEVMRMWMQPGDYCSYVKEREVDDGNTN